MATDHERRIAELLTPSAHMEGCPGEDWPEDSPLEAFEVERVVKRHVADEQGERDVVAGREPVSVVRCITCGAQRTFESPLTDRLAGDGERQ